MSHKRSGFTLIELLIVMVIVTVLYAVLFSSGMSIGSRIAERSRLNETVSLLRMARQQAIAESVSYTVAFADSGITISKEVVTGSVTIVRTSALPAGFTLSQPVTIAFNAQGHPSDAGTIVLVNSKGKERRIAVAVGTGRVRLY